MTLHSDKRKSGISLIGDLPWGSHFCQFYQTNQDMLDMLVPYFRAGLENNEFCVWVTSGMPGIEDAKKALKNALPDFETYAKNRQIEIIPSTRCHNTKGQGARGKGHEAGKVIISLLDRAISNGFDGLRLACHAFPENEDGKAFTCCGIETISRYNVLAVFAYPRDRFDAIGLMNVVKNHQAALVKNAGRWEVLESSEARTFKDALKRSEEKLHSLFSNMSEGFAYHRIVLDEKGMPCDYIFLEVNESFGKLTGLTGKDIIGKKVTEALPGIEKDPTDWIRKYGKVALTGKPIQFESYSGPLKKWFSVSAFSPHKGYFAVTFSDITERKQAEEEIKKLNENLELHVLQLEAANKELEAFSYSVSHDLRSPLRSIAGFSQVLLEDYADKLDTEGKDSIRRVHAATQRMGQLIDDLLDLSRVTRTEMKLERVDLSGLVRQIAGRLRETQPERKAEFIIAEGLYADGDRRLLNAALDNLLINAWKFTGRHPEAVIEFGVEQHEGKQVYFVRDDGAGFDKAYSGKLFNPFQRLHGESEFPGTGIGLATVKRIINRHGGEVWIEGEKEKGATVYFTL